MIVGALPCGWVGAQLLTHTSAVGGAGRGWCLLNVHPHCNAPWNTAVPVWAAFLGALPCPTAREHPPLSKIFDCLCVYFGRGMQIHLLCYIHNIFSLNTKHPSLPPPSPPSPLSWRAHISGRQANSGWDTMKTVETFTTMIGDHDNVDCLQFNNGDDGGW